MRSFKCKSKTSSDVRSDNYFDLNQFYFYIILFFFTTFKIPTGLAPENHDLNGLASLSCESVWRRLLWFKILVSSSDKKTTAETTSSRKATYVRVHENGLNTSLGTQTRVREKKHSFSCARFIYNQSNHSFPAPLGS